MTVQGNNTYIPLRLNQNEMQGLVVSRASTTTVGVSAGQVRDQENVNQMVLPSAVTINFSNVGVVNGLDTGTIGVEKFYYIFLIGSSMDTSGLVYPVGALASLSATPLLPFGYDQYKRIGWQRTGGASTLLPMYQTGNGNVRNYYYDTMIVVLSVGAQTSLTEVSLISACPPLDNMEVLLHVEFTPASAGNSVKFAPFGSVATVIPGISGVVAGQMQVAELKVLAKLGSGIAKLLYINSAAVCASSAYVYGFQDVIS